ncbi:MAG TPA: sugar transferase [Solirubrobacteraceae bacterium]|nr:sugar transferase [Solirubrobacteraceae bacterium]
MLAKESRFETRGATSAHNVQAQSNGSAALTAPRGLVRPHWGIRVDAAAKRGLDIFVAVVALVLLAPLIMLVALLVRLDSHGPAFFQAARVGHGGRDLRMLKFRKMHNRAHGIPLTVDDDARFTRVGSFLARFKLDELPQFWHVLRGEMSLVGPRPETVDFVSHHRDAYYEILGVRPGVFGFSQIAFVAEGRILDEDDPMSHYITDILPQKVKLDLMYARERTLALDVRIMFWSLVAVLLRRQVAVNRQTGRMNLRRR